ncbi:MAG: hydrogenase expression/formation protein HypE [bacterium]
MNNEELITGMNCPVPLNDYEKILLAHGGGGTLSHNLIKKIIQPQFSNKFLDEMHDSAVLEIDGKKIAFTTDSYVVKPIFFPGGDIGKLSICGTVNDLVCAGAKPLFISVGFILEEGFTVEDFKKIISSMSEAAQIAGVQIVTGDTKVVERGKGDQIYINTSSIGEIYDGVSISPKKIEVGDKIILSGKIAEHGIAIMASRESLDFETTIISDVAPLNGLLDEIFKVTKNIHVMRDPTRGGIASALNEIAESANKEIIIDESKIPVSEEVKGACELLGFDPLYIANEGKLLIFLPEEESEKVFDVIRNHPLGKDAQIIGEVTNGNSSRVLLKTIIGTTRIVDMISGEQLPRIC